MRKILVVDDDDEFRSDLSAILGDLDYHTDTASTEAEAISKTTSKDFDVVLLDLMMPETNGMDILGALQKRTPKTKVIMITAFACVDTAVEAIKKGASDYISKPFNIASLEITLKKTFEEIKFNKSLKGLGLDDTLGSLTNYIRRDIIKLLDLNKKMRLMELTRALEIADHTKVLFHLKILRNAGIISHKGKSYFLTKEGENIFNALLLLEDSIAMPEVRYGKDKIKNLLVENN
jgi:DNA-binding response OmpR family regulator